MKYLYSIIVIVLLTFSCKKKTEPVDLCKNGFKDIGETGVDCGGNCEPCPKVYLPNLYMVINGKPITFKNRTITELNGDWFLNCYNDSIQLQFNLGNDISTGIYTMPLTNNIAVYKGLSYSLTTNGNLGISSNDPVDKRVSGFFGTKFYHTGQIDTLTISNGAFTDIVY